MAELKFLQLFKKFSFNYQTIYLLSIKMVVRWVVQLTWPKKEAAVNYRYGSFLCSIVFIASRVSQLVSSRVSQVVSQTP